MKNRDEAWMQERKKEFETLIDFSNEEVQSMEDEDIANLVYRCHFFENDRAWQSFLLRSRSSDFSPDPGDRAERMKSLLELQAHLREKLEKILASVNTESQAPILEIVGTTVVKAHPQKDRFLLNLKEDKEADPLKKEKARLDLRLLDLIRILGLKPRRFKSCPECNHFFYQFTSKEKIYCSTRCSNATRQSRFQLKKSSPGRRDLKESHVDVERREVIGGLKNEQSSMDGE